jgi:hypothetical protein
MRIPDLIAALSQLDSPVVDRSVCERVFRVGRRQANHIMRGFGGYKSGNTVLLDRPYLIAALERLAQSPEVRREHTRKRRLSDHLDELHRYAAARSILLPTSRAFQSRHAERLPAGVALTPGRLIVSFGVAEELFARLYELTQLAVTDFERIRDLADSGPPRTPAEKIRDAVYY